MEDKELFDELAIDPYLFYEAVVNSTDDYIYVVNMKQDISLVSENMLADFDLPGRFVKGLIPLWGNLVLEKDRPRYNASIEAMMNKETNIHDVEYQIKNRKNEYIWVVCRGLLKRNEQGEPTVFAGVITNLGNKGKIDPITGLFTQNEFSKDYVHFLDKKEAQGGVILIGLDEFSRINALHDHIFGNAVLRQFAQNVQPFLPEEASIYRFDGDEFSILYPGAGKQELIALYQKLHAYSNRRQCIDGIPYYCTLSAGAILIPEDGQNYVDIIKYASSALEASKKRGKNTLTFFSSDLIKNKLRAMELSNILQDCVTRQMENFMVYYQPLADAKTTKIKGAEALLRWKCDRFGIVSPSEFIPLLESSGLMIAAGRWVMDHAMQVCKQWTLHQPDFVMNINVSYLQILDPFFLELVKGLLTKHHLDAKHIVLELTESCFVTDMDALQDCFQKLRALGIRLAMDDFGTGYSSLGLLAKSPADIVKVDRLFISSIHEDKVNLDFISAIINLCHSVDISVTVEGVETKEELEAIQSIHADTIQGSYFSFPIDEEAFYQTYILIKAETH